MARTLVRLFAVAILFACAAGSLPAQEKCTPPPIPEAPPGSNIFTDQQEVDLGDVMAEQIERNFRVIHDGELAAHMNDMIGRVLAQLPPTQLKIRAVLIDLSILNAFSLPGGRIYVARKMVAFLRNEDELAGLLGHEMGHILTHQGGIRTTRLFREVLGVSSVGDRKDIFDKFNRLIDNAARNPKAFRPDAGQEEPHQYQADLVSLIAVSNAGFSSQAFVNFFDRLAQTQGKMGNFFTDFFGITTQGQKRLREMHKSLDRLPASCRQMAAAAPSEEFQDWQAEVVSYAGLGKRDSLTGLLDKKALDPPLRTDIFRLKYSRDGNYVLAQDDWSIFVLSRDPLKVEFRIDARDAHLAQFTPDSRGIVFDTRGLRVEEWNIEEEERLSAHEVTIPGGCMQSHLSPDGKTLACVNWNYDISLTDVGTGNSLFTKKGLFEPQVIVWQMTIRMLSESASFEWVHMEFSPDAHYFVGAVSSARIAFDLTTRQTIALHGALGMLGGGFTFIAPDRILAEDRSDEKHSALVEFPSGRVLQRIPLFKKRIAGVAQPNYVLVSPVKDARGGLMDLNTQVVFTGPMKTTALDAFDNQMVAEKSSGELGIFDLGTHKLVAKVALPRSPLGLVRTWGISPDLKWLAISGTTRGAVWDLSNSKRLYFTRGFRGVYFDPGKILYADFPKLESQPRAVALMDLGGRGIGEGISLSEDVASQQYGPYVLIRKQAGKHPGLSRDIVVEVQDIHDGRSLWTRSFPKEAPAITVNPQANRMVLEWRIEEGAAKDELTLDAGLQSRLSAMQGHEGAYLLEVLEVSTGKILGKLLVDTGKGSFRLSGAQSAGDWVWMPDNQNRTLVYSLSTGEKKVGLFGTRSLLSPAAELLLIENESGQLDIYGLPSLEKKSQLSFSSPISAEAFSEDGKRLFVLTSNQTAYIFDTSRLTKQEPAQAGFQ